MKILISISKGLKLIKENYRQAKGNKHAGTLVIDPNDFLILTTRTNKGIAEIMEEAKTLEEYNKFAKNGETILMPWLEVSMDGRDLYNERDIKVGQIIGHEGRHRAAALIKAGVNKMPISVRLYVKGIEKQFKPTAENPWGTDPWTKDDLPKTLYGEFTPSRSVNINTSTFKVLK